MTWNSNKPSASESPSLAPTQIQTNWSRLQLMIQSDHVFNSVADTDDGWHKIVNFVNQGGDIGDGTPTPAAGRAQFYTKTITTLGNASSTAGAGEQLCVQRGSGGGTLQEASLSVAPVRACVSFDGRSTNGVATLGWAFNVASVDRTATGRYTINFETDLPSVYYVMAGSALQVSIVIDTRSASIVSRAKAVDTLQITCHGRGGNFDPDQIDVVVYGG